MATLDIKMFFVRTNRLLSLYTSNPAKCDIVQWYYMTVKLYTLWYLLNISIKVVWYLV